MIHMNKEKTKEYYSDLIDDLYDIVHRLDKDQVDFMMRMDHVVHNAGTISERDYHDLKSLHSLFFGSR